MSLDVYWYYFKTLGIWMTFWTVFLNAACEGFIIGTSIWLAMWSEQGESGVQDAHSRDVFLGVYGGLGIGQGEDVKPCCFKNLGEVFCFICFLSLF